MKIASKHLKFIQTAKILEQYGNKRKPNPVNVRQALTYLRLEPYEGKISHMVLRWERRGNPPNPANTTQKLEFYNEKCTRSALAVLHMPNIPRIVYQ